MTDDDQRPDGRPTWGTPGERPGAPKAREQLADQGVIKKRPPAAATAHAVQSWVDQTIAQAERQGKFSDLPGAGKPLRDVDTRTDPDWWVKSLIEREKLDLSDAMPGVMQLRREKAGFPESLVQLDTETAVRERLEDFNERVLADRRRPHAGAQSPPIVGRVDVDEMVEAWRELRAAASPATTEPQDPTAADRDAVAGVAPTPRRGRRRWWGLTDR
ncbi:DUF1992 domain-containing protein [Ornithinimicrobium panacihumi]|uniref:DnaJ family domain-containing protein n=1 Tax=Ornithinimicrobium panacihumi TaxID=2008449 RepID=UPI003F8B1B9D